MSDVVARLNAALEGRYTIEREIGRGGMATVYLAEDLRHERSVALKVLEPDLAAAVGASRFLVEIKTTANLQHPHILPLFDSGVGDGLFYYAMPYVEGESVRQRLKREKQLPIDEAIHIVREVADALSYAHGHGVIHRDIKPSNILLDSGHAVVADFGIALMVHTASTERLTGSGISPGSPLYMSPEQLAGDMPVDARSDIYSLGCVLYEMLAGDPPFTGSIPQVIFARKLVEPVPKLSVARDTVPEYVVRAATRALAKTPADRFHSAEEFARALAGDTEGFPVGVDQPLDPEATQVVGVTKSPSRPGLLMPASIVVLLLTLIGLLTTLVYDEKLALPAEYTPSRLNFPFVGLRAVIPVLFIAFTTFVAFVALKYLWRLSALGVSRVPGVADTLDSWRHASTEAARRAWIALSPTTVADLFFLGATIIAVLVMVFFRELLLAMWTSDTGILSCSSRSFHQTYTVSLTLLIMGLFLAWTRVFGQLRTRATVTHRIGASLWGSLGLIVILLLMVTMPWRLLYDNEHSRVLIDGERAYVLVETETELVLYGAESGSTERYRKDEDLSLDRLGADGYLFEGPAAFDEGSLCRG